LLLGPTPFTIAVLVSREPREKTVPFITPVEIRHIRLKRGVNGYDRKTTEHLLVDISGSYEKVWQDRDALRVELKELHERADDTERLAREVERLERELEKAESVDEKLRTTLFVAERTAETVKQEARAEAEQALRKAREHADKIVRAARSEHSRLVEGLDRLRQLEETTRAGYRAFLETALSQVDEEVATGAVEEAEAPQSPLISPLGHLPIAEG
jgi:cell division initiation protein